MKRIIQIVFCLAALFCGANLNAQTMERQVIASGGSVQTASGAELSSTIGEAVTASFTSGTVNLSQGFQQGGSVSTAIAENKIKMDYKLYPNPTRNKINIDLTADKAIEGELKLISIDGKLILSKRIQIQASQAFKFSYNMEQLPAGIYILSIQSNNGEAQVVDKIQKAN